MPYIAMKDFRFSRNGLTTEDAVKGQPVNVPENLVAGLERERFIAATGEHKNAGASPENKMLGSGPENKDDLNALRAEYQHAFNKKPFMGWDADTLKSKIAEA